MSITQQYINAYDEAQRQKNAQQQQQSVVNTQHPVTTVPVQPATASPVNQNTARVHQTQPIASVDNKGVVDVGAKTTLTQTGNYQPVKQTIVSRAPELTTNKEISSLAIKGGQTKEANPNVFSNKNIWEHGSKGLINPSIHSMDTVSGAKGQSMSPDEKMRVARAIEKGNSNQINPHTGEFYTDAQQHEIEEGHTKSWRDSLTDEEKEKRSNNRKMMMLAIGDSLRHLGNLYFTNRGATPQQFNNPVVDEYNRQKTDEKEKKAAQLAKDKIAYERYKDALEQQNKDRSYALNARGVGIKEQELENNKKKADSYVKTQESQQRKNKADEERIKSSAKKIDEEANLVRAKAENQGDLMKSQTNLNIARANKASSDIAVNASTIAKNNAQTAKLWKDIGQDEKTVNINSWYGKLTRNRKTAPTSDQVANMYNRLKDKGLIDNATKTDIENILAQGNSSETTQKQMNAIMKSMTSGGSSSREAVARELVKAGWYNTTSNDQVKQMQRREAKIKQRAASSNSNPKTQPATSPRGKKRGGSKVSSNSNVQTTSRGIV